MHFLDPDRPRLHGTDGLPLLQGVSSRVVLPSLHVSPRGTPDASLLEVSAFFPSSLGGASRREITLEIWEFPAFWLEWLSDPEHTAKTRFGWEPQATPTQKTPLRTMTIEDLLGN